MHKSTASKHKHTRAHNSYGLNSDLAKIKAALSHATSGVKDKAGLILNDQWNDVKDKTVDMQEYVTDYIAEKPLKSLGFALFTGFIIGFFLRK